MEAKRYAMVLIGGSGERFSSPLPKQFIPFAGIPLFLYPLLTLNGSDDIDSILIVTKKGTVDLVKEILESHPANKVFAIIEGGDSRQESSRLGLEFLFKNKANESDIVLIQDGDRPNLKRAYVEESILLAASIGAAVVAIPSSDSLLLAKQNGERVKGYLRRDEVYRVQTPQTFRFGDILKAHQAFKDEPVTDDASLIVKMGGEVGIVKGDEDNYKINEREDGDRFLLELERRKAK